MNAPAYAPRLPSRLSHVEVRGLRLALREWGAADAPLLLLLHGHRDASPTFQFLVDALQRDWRIVAPDWRGHGASAWATQGYWYQDYLADLDALMERISPHAPARLVGHSLGGNIACVYAGLRPDRVARLVSIDGFGLKHREADEAPDHLRLWLDASRRRPAERVYADAAEMAERLRKANPRLTQERAQFLAREVARPVAGGFAWAFDPAHRRPFATLHRVDEWAACWRRIAAPTLWVVAGDRFARMPRAGAYGFDWRLAQIPHARSVLVEGTGHNIHHDAPERLAAIVEPFLAD